MKLLQTLIILVFVCNNIAFASEILPKIIGVFCSADDKIPDAFKQEAFTLGQYISLNNFGLVTGGSKTGLMKEVVDGYSTQKTNEYLYGVIPYVLKKLDIHHHAISENNLLWTEDIHQRLDLFIQKCDIIFILPGGFGTLNELMDFLVHQQFGLIKKKIILVNMLGYWDPLLNQFKKMVETNSLQQKHLDQLIVISSVKEFLEVISRDDKEKNETGLMERYWEKK